MDGIEKIMDKKIRRVKCPKCGYLMPIYYAREAESHGVVVPCKGRNCGALIEIKIKNGKQIR